MFSEFAEVSAATWGVIVALLLVGIIVFAVSKDKKRWTARMLANGALCIALATVLSFVTLYKMPQGGTITLASMLPIFLFSYAYGVGPGMLVGAAYGFVQFLQGGLYFVHLRVPVRHDLLRHVCAGGSESCGVFHRVQRIVPCAGSHHLHRSCAHPADSSVGEAPRAPGLI